jgi:hypothetical protein
MRDLTDYSERELNEFWSTLMIKIHQEFCEQSRSYEMWKAGIDTIMEIGGHYHARKE